MIRIGLRDAKAHFHRLVMSIIAIALGVSFVVGSFCFRSMLNDQVMQLMGANSDHDVYVRGATEEQNDSPFATSGPISSGTSYNKIDTSLVTQIEQVKGIDNVSPPERTIGATLLDHDGNAVVTTGAPTLMISASSEHPWRAANFIAGTYATGEHEIALSQDAAKKAGLQVGDTTRLIVNGEPHTMKVSGIFTTQTAELGVLIILAQPALVNQLMQLQGEDTSKVDKIGVYGNRTTPLTVQKQHQLADHINKALPKDSKAHAVTGQSVRDEATKSTQESLGFVQPLILIFAVIALFVGAFIIANTFTMIVRDSMRGYALLRSVGASPAQVFFSVVIQALILGVIGSVLGVLLGWGLIELIDWGLSKGGFPLSGSPTPSPTAVAVGFIVGVVVTVIGSAIPARTAATAPPIQAMNETMNPEKPVTARGWIGADMVAFGALCWLLCWLLAAKKVSWAWLTTVGTGWLLGLGGVCTAGGVIVLAPALVTGAAKVLGWLPSRIPGDRHAGHPQHRPHETSHRQHGRRPVRGRGNRQLPERARLVNARLGERYDRRQSSCRLCARLRRALAIRLAEGRQRREAHGRSRRNNGGAHTAHRQAHAGERAIHRHGGGPRTPQCHVPGHPSGRRCSAGHRAWRDRRRTQGRRLQRVYNRQHRGNGVQEHRHRRSGHQAGHRGIRTASGRAGVGTSNGQVRGMIAIESVILSVFGTVLGILVGLGAGVVVRQAYRDNGLSTMSIPWLQLLGFLGAAILVGLIASISPASRALKKPVLEAVASD